MEGPSASMELGLHSSRYWGHDTFGTVVLPGIRARAFQEAGLNLKPARLGSNPQVGNQFQRIVEAVGEIRRADDERQLDDLPVVVKFLQFLKRRGANP